MAINNPVVTDSDWLQATAVAIQNKDGGSKIEVPDFASRIDALPTGGNTLDEYFANTLEVANIPSATTIAKAFFVYKSNLVNVIMPNVTSIGSDAFSGCTNLALTSLPNAITRIETGTFYGCQHLALTSLPSGVTSIGNHAFTSCVRIPYLDFSEFTQIPTVTTIAFTGTSFPFYFRNQQQLDEWAAATNWSTYAGRFQIKPSEVI